MRKSASHNGQAERYFHLPSQRLRAARLDRSPDNHVVLHELIHGDRLVNDMDMSHRMLARVAELVLAYPRQVHPILANHEIAQYRRHHISKGAGDNLELFDAGLDWVYGDEAEVAATARSRSAVMRVARRTGVPA